ncbi:MAG: hypothetical protein EB127_09000 [Alphaproteobacteria bacterium]|nr:hypothetical protein [Alphaproteobacteria bacterium]
MTWIVKDSNGEYYGFRKDAIHWHQEQSKADRFKTREEAEKISKCLNDQHYESRIVKLKVCQDDESNRLPEPKIGTVFIDNGSTIKGVVVPHIVACVTHADDCDVEVHTLDVNVGEGVWGTLEEYHEFIKNGEIKIIWEPKQ